MNKLYPPIEPYNEFFLKVSKLHTIFVEESGNPEGKPVIFLHGGPGGGSEPIYRQYFDPQKWRELLFLIREVVEKAYPMQNLKKIPHGI